MRRILIIALLLAPSLAAGDLMPPGPPAPTEGSLEQAAAAVLAEREAPAALPTFGIATRFALTLTAGDGSPEVVGDDTVGSFTNVIEVFGAEMGHERVFQQNQTDLAFLRRLAFVKPLDESSPLLLHASCAGRVFESASLRILDGGNAAAIELKNVQITSYQLGVVEAEGGGHAVVDTMTITYTGLEYEHTPSGYTVRIDEDGRCTLSIPGGT